MEIDHPRKLKKIVKAWLFTPRKLRRLERRRLIRMFNRERRKSGIEPLPPHGWTVLDSTGRKHKRPLTLIDLP